MRTLAVLLLLLITAAPALAGQSCSLLKHSPHTVATPETKGQQPIVVRITVPIESEDEVRRSQYSFSIMSLDTQFRYDNEQVVVGIGRCVKDSTDRGMFVTGGTTWIRLTGFVVYSTDTIMTLESQVLIPASVVSKQPLVLANLKSGSYMGRWITENEKTVLVLEERK
jgi:hypothetical protein